MSRTELQDKIQKLLETVPDSVLAELVGYLSSLESHGQEEIEMAQNLKKILEEDRNLLNRLAS